MILVSKKEEYSSCEACDDVCAKKDFLQICIEIFRTTEVNQNLCINCRLYNKSAKLSPLKILVIFCNFSQIIKQWTVSQLALYSRKIFIKRQTQRRACFNV